MLHGIVLYFSNFDFSKQKLAKTNRFPMNKKKSSIEIISHRKSNKIFYKKIFGQIGQNLEVKSGHILSIIMFC